VEFLYFELEMVPPKPEDYWAEWHESGGKGVRKKSINLSGPQKLDTKMGEHKV
jgi:hypothetical protein